MYSPSSISLSSSSTWSSWESNDSNMLNLTKEDLVKSGFYRTKRFEEVICSGCGWNSGSTRLTIRHLNFIHKICNPDCKMSEFVIEDFNNYCKNKRSVNNTEKMMEETFLMWPKAYPNIAEMVRTGFYYTGTADSTACICCGVVLDQWSPEDIPEKEHKKASPDCELFNN